MPKRGTWVDVIEACYADADDSSWSGALLEAAARVADQGLGVSTLTYDASGGSVRVLDVRTTKQVPLGPDAIARMVESVTPAYVDASWRRLSCGLASEVPGWSAEPARNAFLARVGVRDILSINACDASGAGFCIGAFLPRRRRLQPGERGAYERVAAHLASTLRLRARVRRADAVLDTSGRLLHAATRAATVADAREALSDAVRRIESARGPMRRRDPNRALGSWRALAAARWSLVDQFESDGRRFIVAMANAPSPSPIAKLTARERCVLGLAAQDHSTKLIAYELGLAESTVRVLLMRAAQALGAKTRRAAIERYRELARVYDGS